MDKVCRRFAQTGDEHRVDIALTASQTARVLWRTSSPARSARRKAPLERPLSARLASLWSLVIGHCPALAPALVAAALDISFSLSVTVHLTLAFILRTAPRIRSWDHTRAQRADTHVNTHVSIISTLVYESCPEATDTFALIFGRL